MEEGEGGDILRQESYAYDPETGRLSNLATEEGNIAYKYDNFGALESIGYLGREVQYDYDFYGRLARVASPEATWEYTYNAAGLKNTVRNVTTGTEERREYDALGRLELLTHLDADDSIIFQADYVLGDDGNRIGIIETRGTDVWSWAYEYDALGRLVSEKYAPGDWYDDGANAVLIPDAERARDVSYTYDADSNRRLETDELAGTQRRYLYEGQSPAAPDAVATSQRLVTIEASDNGDASWRVAEEYTWTPNGETASRTWYDDTGAVVDAR